MIASQLKATGKGANINFTRRGGVLKAEIKFESNGASYPRDLRMRRVPQFQKNIQAHEALMWMIDQGKARPSMLSEKICIQH